MLNEVTAETVASWMLVNIEAAVYAMEELEETAKLALIIRGYNPQLLTAAQVNGIVGKFDVEWDV